jgi:hypothetical protein
MGQVSNIEAPLRKTNKFIPEPSTQEEIIERFWSQVRKGDGCWEWQSGRFSSGYGQYRVGKKKVRTHRFAWEISNGSILVGMHVCHRCDNPICVRPDHLFLGTPLENMQDRDRKGRRVQGRITPGALAGENNPAAKITRQIAEQIRVEFGSKPQPSKASIARKYKISQSQVRNIIEGRSWNVG